MECTVSHLQADKSHAFSDFIGNYHESSELVIICKVDLYHANRAECPLWVICGRSTSYQSNGRYGVYSGRSAGFFQMYISERPLFSKAVIRSRQILTI